MATKLSLNARTGYETDYNSDLFGIDCSMDAPITKQSFAGECDVNAIVSRMNSSGYIPPVFDASMFSDVSDVPDYHTCLNFVNDARGKFMALPSDVRSRFDNDPAQFLAFASVPENLPELVSMGLAVKRPEASAGPPGSPLADASGQEPTAPPSSSSGGSPS
jgi:hypothetical protein